MPALTTTACRASGSAINGTHRAVRWPPIAAIEALGAIDRAQTRTPQHASLAGHPTREHKRDLDEYYARPARDAPIQSLQEIIDYNAATRTRR